MKDPILPLLALLLAGPALAPAAGREAETDAAWKHFENWVRTTPPRTERPSRPLRELYVDRLLRDGLPRETAERRAGLVLEVTPPPDRRRALVYWDAMFKFGGGPDRPLRLLADVVRGLPPGCALDAAMGSGRNAVYLASIGWKVAGYDISPTAIALARRRAARLSTEFEMVQAGHREFAIGRERWDLIVLSFIVADPGDLEAAFGARFWESLRPGGRIVCEGHFCEPLVRHLFPLKLQGFRLERYTDSDDIRDGWVADDMPGRVVRAVIRRLPE